jgi:hypothetical protein
VWSGTGDVAAWDRRRSWELRGTRPNLGSAPLVPSLGSARGALLGVSLPARRLGSQVASPSDGSYCLPRPGPMRSDEIR